MDLDRQEYRTKYGYFIEDRGYFYKTKIWYIVSENENVLKTSPRVIINNGEILYDNIAAPFENVDEWFIKLNPEHQKLYLLGLMEGALNVSDT